MRDRSNEAPIADVATVAAPFPWAPMRGPKNRIATNDASGISQAIPSKIGKRYAAVLYMLLLRDTHYPCKSSARSTSTVAWLL